MELIRKIFIIMPFRKTSKNHTEIYWTNHFNQILKPYSETPDFPAERSSPLRKDVLKEIIINLIYSHIVLADITDLNENVMWELGVRQSFTNGTIVIAEKGTKKPFDIITKSIILYPKTSDPNYDKEMSEFKEKLKEAINDCINNPDTSDSHVLETINGRGTIYWIIYHDEILRMLNAVIYEVESNINLLSKLDEAIDFNKKFECDTKGGGCELTSYFRTPSIELLLTTRYLPQMLEFYLKLQKYYDDLGQLNSEIDLLPRDKKTAIFWYTRHRHKITDFNALLNEIKEIEEKIKRQKFI